ncbi:DUF1800 domain-containing protein [Maribacter sp.]|nr:DUF1800 domain-containing protein [Maribacter sp.]
MSTNCNNAPLTVYGASNPWSVAEVYHLYRRAAFGISPEDAQVILTKTPQQAVDDLVDAAFSLAPIAAPSWADNFSDSDLNNNDLKRDFRYTMLSELKNNDLRDRLLLFWSNHFVTEYSQYRCPSYWYDYINILQRNCLGNLKTFVHEIGLAPAMLSYLNGNQNRNNRPNENYARELYELFTLGEGIGYTQTDIEETAKALTGYTLRADRCAPYTFLEDHFNATDKTIFGRTGNWGYDDVIDILFEERPNEIGKLIVTKLYRYFVHPELPAESILDELASDFVNSGFEIEPVVRKLLRSEHFFDTNAQGVIIKSPLDLLIPFYNQFMMPFPVLNEDYIAAALFNWSGIMGQVFFQPPDVAGWKGDKSWINSSLLLNRWRYHEQMLNRLYYHYDKELFRDLAIAIVNDPGEDDVAVISNKILETYLPKSLLTASDYQNALETFKSNVPANYFDEGIWDLQFPTVPLQMWVLLIHITAQPEYQLK